MENEEPLAHLMDYLLGFFILQKFIISSINCVTPVHQINIQQLIL